MFTDGALRMLVLLNFHLLGFSPIQLAYLFLIYEFMGTLTNFFGGYLVKKFGLIPILYSGLTIQTLSLLGLAVAPMDLGITLSVFFVMIAQGFSGVAKDLTKVSAKSAVKILAPKTSNNTLFKWVAILTGSKNAMKGLGFLSGAVLLAIFDYVASLAILIGILVFIFCAIVVSRPSLKNSKIKAVKLKNIFSTNSRVNYLSLARLFLFGARDVWFVVGVPIYFLEVFKNTTIFGGQSAFFLVGGFMAIWVILYGVTQASAHKLFRNMDGTRLKHNAVSWASLSMVAPLLLALAAFNYDNQTLLLTGSLVVGLLFFGAIFAVNSSLHSFLILKYTTLDRAPLDVGFYYTANASGRLLGTLMSGASYEIGGLSFCLFTAFIFLMVATVCTKFIPAD